ncbi:MAG TPA: flagellar assembly protein FliW [Sediminispirochaeta sp.]|nr:flagellar assembly protein FliW [Sediminispirochaeta sp.]
MKVNTKAYGLIDVDERQKIYFPSGLLGFENLKNYVLLDALQQPFYWLQSVDVQEIAFVLIDPSIFRPDYKPRIAQYELDEIGLEAGDRENALIFSIVTIPEDHQNMTANLQGPVIINKSTHNARQCITEDDRWKTRHKVMEELANVRGSAC